MDKSMPGISKFGYAVYNKLPNEKFERVKAKPVFLMFLSPKNKQLKVHNLNAFYDRLSSFHIDDVLFKTSLEMEIKHAFVSVEHVIDYLCYRIQVLRNCMKVSFAPELATKCCFITKPLNFIKLKDRIDAPYFEADSCECDEDQSLVVGGNLTFLIAEDVDINRILIKRMLNKLWPSATVLEAEDGNQAAEIAIKIIPDLILMDIKMPELNGFDAFEKIKVSLTENDMMPVIALTASATDEIKARASEIGMDDIAVKPVTIESLKSIIVKVFTKCGKSF